MSKSVQQPKLGKPGAGLPLPELWIVRIVGRRFMKKATRESAIGDIISYKDKILEVVENARESGADLKSPVLIDRIRGMEDSSRYWSIYMVLDHLRIVNGLVGLTIRNLGKGQVPGRRASTAEVKPSIDSDESVVEKFSATCDLMIHEAEKIADLKTEQKHEHPWFGPMDAHAWLTLGGFHMGLHLRQMQKILEKS